MTRTYNVSTVAVGDAHQAIEELPRLLIVRAENIITRLKRNTNTISVTTKSLQYEH